MKRTTVFLSVLVTVLLLFSGCSPRGTYTSELSGFLLTFEGRDTVFFEAQGAVYEGSYRLSASGDSIFFSFQNRAAQAVFDGELPFEKNGKTVSVGGIIYRK